MRRKADGTLSTSAHAAQQEPTQSVSACCAAVDELIMLRAHDRTTYILLQELLEVRSRDLNVEIRGGGFCANHKEEQQTHRGVSESASITPTSLLSLRKLCELTNVRVGDDDHDVRVRCEPAQKQKNSGTGNA